MNFSTWLKAFNTFYTDPSVLEESDLRSWWASGKSPEWTADHYRHLSANIGG